MNANTIFQLCVDLLRWLANIFGCTYQEINIIIFVILNPSSFYLCVGLFTNKDKLLESLKPNKYDAKRKYH